MSHEALRYVIDRKQAVLVECEQLRHHRLMMQNQLTTLQSQINSTQQKEDQLHGELRRLNDAHLAELQKQLDRSTESPIGTNFNRSVATAVAGNSSTTVEHQASEIPILTNEVDAADHASHADASSDGSFLNALAMLSKRPTEELGEAAIDHPIPKKRPRCAQKLALDELREYASKISQYWNSETKKFNCPVCAAELKTTTLQKVCLHMLDHFGDKAFFPYKCPVDGCDYASVRPGNIQVHVKGFHKLEWSEELKLASAHNENKALLFSLFSPDKDGKKKVIDAGLM